MDLPLPALIPSDYLDDIHQRLIFAAVWLRPVDKTRGGPGRIMDRYGPFSSSLGNLLLPMD
jgi:hypothetical protein